MDPDRLPVGGLLVGVVVMDVDTGRRIEAEIQLEPLFDQVGEDLGEGPAHPLAILHRVILGPQHILEIVLAFLGVERQHPQIARRLDLEPLVERLGDGDVVLGDLVAGAATAAVEHQPDHAVFVFAQLQKVIAATQRAELPGRFLPHNRRDGLGVAILVEAIPIQRAAVLAEAGRDMLFGQLMQLAQKRLRQIDRAHVEGLRQHPAADVHADSGREQHIGRCKHAANRCAETIVF